MKLITLAAVNAAAALFVHTALADTATMPPETGDGLYYGNARGYWFTAPTDFQITGIRVLAPAIEGDFAFMNWAVIRFNGAIPPPAWPGGTDAFTHLGLGFGQPANAFYPVS